MCVSVYIHIYVNVYVNMCSCARERVVKQCSHYTLSTAGIHLAKNDKIKKNAFVLR